ncbi:alpha/beta hydrolase [Nocardia sp. AG03]|uniref:alpha/beta fold hydrolase n=1 Tax=Nocardia sp. AG03 TaxID=3025312 RepID=UPI00241899D2|nr:alpha/beta hydrolase [Nocardia sp. AG03]
MTPWLDRTLPGAVDQFVAWTTGPPDRTLLVIHGGPDWDHTYLRHPLDRLAGHHRLLLPDLRGCGRSTCGLPPTAFAPDTVVVDLIALLDAFDTRRADVLGFSFGGLLAQRLAVTVPDRIGKVIIASSSVLPVPPDAYPDTPHQRSIRAAENAVWSDLSRTGPARTEAAARAGARSNLARASAARGYHRRLSRIRFSADWANARDAGALRSPRLAHPVERLSATGLPILLLHGRHDLTFPAGLAVEAAARIPGARAVVLERAAHMAHIDQPRRWLAEVSAFLR